MTVDSVLETLFSTPLGVDIALGFIALEFAFLLWRCPPKTKFSKTYDLILALGPGVCLMLALRCAVIGSGASWIALWLAASLPLHLADTLKRKL